MQHRKMADRFVGQGSGLVINRSLVRTPDWTVTILFALVVGNVVFVVVVVVLVFFLLLLLLLLHVHRLTPLFLGPIAILAALLRDVILAEIFTPGNHLKQTFLQGLGCRLRAAWH
jgi:hypothetical protein